MSNPFHQQVDQLMAEFAQQQSRLLGVRKDLEKATVTATSKDHLVTVTVGVGGDVRKIAFHSTDYAGMAPAELGSMLVLVLNQARDKATLRAQDAFAPLADFGADLRASLAGNPEIDELLAPLTETLRPGKRPAPMVEDFDG